MRPRSVIVRVRGGAFNPDVASLEELALPDRSDLLDAFDRVSAGREGVPPMRRGRCYCDAGAADFDSPGAMMNPETDAGPARCGLRDNPFERPNRQRIVGLIFEMTNDAADVVIPDQPEKRRDSAVGPGRGAAVRDGGNQRLELQRSRANRQERDGHDVQYTGQ